MEREITGKHGGFNTKKYIDVLYASEAADGNSRMCLVMEITEASAISIRKPLFCEETGAEQRKVRLLAWCWDESGWWFGVRLRFGLMHFPKPLCWIHAWCNSPQSGFSCPQDSHLSLQCVICVDGFVQMRFAVWMLQRKNFMVYYCILFQHFFVHRKFKIFSDVLSEMLP